MTPADFRALIARRQAKLYVVAAAIQLNPQRLGLMLREKIPMTPEVASRLRSALAREQEEARI
jgi:hypothetical protein